MFVISAAVLGLAQAMALLVLGSIALITTESAAFSPSLPSYAPLRR
jgi:hypothetical protein